MTTQIPCRAKNPDTCVYHGAERRAEAALLRGDADTWLRETENMLRNSDIEEVQAFIAEHAQQTTGRVPLKSGHRYETAAVNRAGTSLENGLTRAHVTFEERLNNAAKALKNGDVVTDYTVGGKPEHLTNEPSNAYRVAYQQIADEVLDISTDPTHYDIPDADSYQIDYNTLQARILDRTAEAKRYGTKEEVAAWQHAYNVVGEWQNDDTFIHEDINYNSVLPTRTALEQLDAAYWEEAAVQPLSATAETSFEERFNNRFYDHTGSYTPYGVTAHTHNLNPYQRALLDASEAIVGRSKSVDTTPNETRILTNTSGNYHIEDLLADKAEHATDPEVERAYRDVRQLVKQSLPVYQRPDNLDTYDLLNSVEKLFARSVS